MKKLYLSKNDEEIVNVLYQPIGKHNPVVEVSDKIYARIMETIRRFDMLQDLLDRLYEGEHNLDILRVLRGDSQ